MLVLSALCTFLLPAAAQFLHLVDWLIQWTRRSNKDVALLLDFRISQILIEKESFNALPALRNAPRWPMSRRR